MLPSHSAHFDSVPLAVNTKVSHRVILFSDVIMLASLMILCSFLLSCYFKNDEVSIQWSGLP